MIENLSVSTVGVDSEYTDWFKTFSEKLLADGQPEESARIATILADLQLITESLNRSMAYLTVVEASLNTAMRLIPSLLTEETNGGIAIPESLHEVVNDLVEILMLRDAILNDPSKLDSVAKGPGEPSVSAENQE